MDVERLITAANIVFEMCRRHPEICPHIYEWRWSQCKPTETLEYYQCSICGKTKTEVIPEDTVADNGAMVPET